MATQLTAHGEASLLLAQIAATLPDRFGPIDLPEPQSLWLNGEQIGVELCLFVIRPRFKCEILYRNTGELRMCIERIINGKPYRLGEIHSIEAMFRQYSPADSFDYFLDRADREFAKMEKLNP